MVSGKIAPPVTLWHYSLIHGIRASTSLVKAMLSLLIFQRLWQRIAPMPYQVNNYGIGNTFIRWLSDFLYNRSIHVVIDGISSNLYPVNSGLPQSSVICPTLHLLFVIFCLYSNLRSNKNYSVCKYSWINARKTQCCLLSPKRTSDGMIMFLMCRKKQPSV